MHRLHLVSYPTWSLYMSIHQFSCREGVEVKAMLCFLWFFLSHYLYLKISILRESFTVFIIVEIVEILQRWSQEDENLDLQPTLFQQWVGDLKGDESISAAG